MCCHFVFAVLRRRSVVLQCLKAACTDGQLLVDLLVNYDCDLEAVNLWERLVGQLVALAQAQPPATSDQTALQQVRERVGVRVRDVVEMLPHLA